MPSSNFSISTEWKPTGGFRIVAGWINPRIEIEEYRRIGVVIDIKQRWTAEEFRYRRIGNKEIHKAKVFEKLGATMGARYSVPLQ